jgi:hypothetical protein
VTGRPELELGARLVEALRPLVEELVEQALEQRDRHPAVEWLTVEEYATRMRTTPGAVVKRIERGRIDGATKDGGRAWLIPIAADGHDTLARDQKRGSRR